MSDSYVILDRDGVINIDSAGFIKSPAEWLPIDGSLEAIALLNEHGFKIAVITNQSGIERGLYDLAALAAIHDKMRQLVSAAGGGIEAIYFCPHGPDSHCNCRKPKPGMFLTFASDRGADLKNTYSVGDSIRDIQASMAAGCRPLLVKTGNGLQTIQNNPQLNVPIFENLYDAATHIISTS
ncbi:MAG: D-glycero-beta-D-manno-heptose 1,7-bisphosphate 7-phosphatase [Methylococcales bacterium]|nr:D-glycero-beta-D-manno-heptose 1,7-bisphosphate 7-phosphatase [Methylococcales bacterium]